MKKSLLTLTATLGLSLVFFAISCSSTKVASAKASDASSAKTEKENSTKATESSTEEKEAKKSTESSGGGSEDSSSGVIVPGATVKGAIEGSGVFIAGRTVTIPNLWVCDHEVTQGEYEKYCSYSGDRSESKSGLGENYPACNVSWNNAIVYCNKRSIAEGLTPCYKIKGKTNPIDWGEVPAAIYEWHQEVDNDPAWDAVSCDFNANGYRLPTEAEWEYLARGGNTRNSGQTKYSGSDDIEAVAWYKENSGRKIHEVKTKAPNSLGLYDMSGNVREWCWDWDSSISTNTPASGATSGSYRVARGGGCYDYANGREWDRMEDHWYYMFNDCSVACQYEAKGRPRYGYGANGFRVVRTVSKNDAESTSAKNDSDKKTASNGGAKALNESMTREQMVYWTSDSKIVHTHEDCRIVRSSVLYYGTVQEAIDAGMSKICKICEGSDEASTAAKNESDKKTASNGGANKPLTVTGQIADSQVFIKGRTVEIWAKWCCDHEVTQAEYQSVMGENPSEFSGSNNPVENVSWYDAIMYCNKRSIADGRTPCYKVDGNADTSQWNYTPHDYDIISGTITCDFTADGYRLPTEAEWEYFARGGNTSNSNQTTYCGSNTIGSVAWYCDNSGRKTHEVKKKAKNALNLYDMSGNVWEWCWDRWIDTITTSTPSSGAASGSVCVVRGGDWVFDASYCAVSFRYRSFPLKRFSYLGFRVVCSRSE